MEKPITNAQLKFNCPVNWDSMEYTTGGKNCHQCQKKVFDLTNCSQYEMDIILAQNNYNICAKFTSQQLAPQKISYPLWKKWVSAAIVLLGFNLFNGKVIAQKIKAIIIQEDLYPKNSGFALGKVVAPLYLPSQFPGGINALNDFITKNIHIQKEGKVLVDLGVDTLGMVKSLKISPDSPVILNPDEQKEIMNGLKLFPQLKPAMWNDKPINYIYTLPITLKKAIN